MGAGNLSKSVFNWGLYFKKIEKAIHFLDSELDCASVSNYDIYIYIYLSSTVLTFPSCLSVAVVCSHHAGQKCHTWFRHGRASRKT